MPENKSFKRIVRKTASEVSEPYTRVAERLRSQPAYVAGYGFRQASAGFHSVEPVSSRQGLSTLVVSRVLGSADRTEVDVVIETPEEFRPTPEMKGPSLSVKLEACGRIEDSSGMSISCGGRRAELRITFPAVSLRARQVTLRLSGDLGEWAVVVPVKPLGGVARRPQPISGAKVTRQGLMLEVTGAVFDLDRTVVRILASAAPPIRFIRGVGTEMGGRRLPGSELSLVDNLGNTYTEQAGAEDRSDPAGRKHTVVFPQVQSSATVFRLHIPFVGVEESGDPAEFVLPVESRKLRIGRYKIEIQATEENVESLADFYPLRIKYRGLDHFKTRRLLGPGQIFVNDLGVAFCFPSFGRGDYVDVQVPNPPPNRIRFAYPRVHLTGPWDLTVRRAG